MLTHPTLDQLRQLGLAGMARAFEDLAAQAGGGELAPAERLGLLLDREIADRHDRRLKARLRFAKLRHQASIEDIDWRSSRGLDRALFSKLAMGGWIEARENLIIEGPTGVGKSWLACALGQKACRDNLSVLYQRVPRLFADLGLARGDGRHARLMRTLGAVKLVWSSAPNPGRLGPRAARAGAGARPAGTGRGPLRPRRHADHQPGPRRPLA